MSQIEIGRVVKPHGIRGEVGVLMHQPQSDLLEHLTEVTLEGATGAVRLVRFERVARMGQGYRVKLVGIDDRNAAEEIRDARITIPREALPQLDDDEAYLVDLVGSSVYAPDGSQFGVVVDILTYPSVDAVVIEKLDGSRVEQPLVEEWVDITHDNSRPQVRLKNLEGLL